MILIVKNSFLKTHLLKIAQGHITLDKILYLFLILYVTSVDESEACDLFFIKREFEKFLDDINEFQGKVC